MRMEAEKQTLMVWERETDRERDFLLQTGLRDLITVKH